MNKADFEAILALVTYKDWTFYVEERPSDEPSLPTYYMQVRFPDADLVTGQIETQHGRKWILSRHMTRSEVVATAFKAVMTAEEHETREKFRYRKRMVYGPHIDVEALAQTCRHLELRDDPKTVAVD